MPSATVKAKEIEYFPLNKPEDWGKALAFAVGEGYRGSFEAYQDVAGEVWHIELNGPGNPAPVTATLTDVLVWDGYHFESMTHEMFSAKHDVD
jgi:hypothetical protein